MRVAVAVAVVTVFAAAALTSCAGTSAPALSTAGLRAPKVSAVVEGKEIVFARRKGHCLACHEIAGGELPGNVGPALADVKRRYPDKSKLRAQIYDARVNNPNTIMPPFGPNRILTDEELDKVVEFVLTL